MEEDGMLEMNAKLTNLGSFSVDQITEVFWGFEEKDTPHPEADALRAIEQRDGAAL